ncbi:hypothetical protein LZ31DRAFT_232282 [Colletotrichum somersetense]|nr:hypothetical protein LZ31DRAFT_232282 [Colletotrichum somersetense]
MNHRPIRTVVLTLLPQASEIECVSLAPVSTDIALDQSRMALRPEVALQILQRLKKGPKIAPGQCSLPSRDHAICRTLL